MNFKSIFNQFCNELTNVEDLSRKFSESKTDIERFEIAYHSSQEYLSHLNLTQTGKIPERSKEIRENGNKCFGNKNYWKSLKLYTESISLAPKESQELALALGNRAACLIKLGLPNEALTDIESALTLTKDPKFKDKLLLRKQKCMQEPNANIPDTEINSEPLLSQGKSTYFDSASSVVNLSTNEQLGRHLIVSDDVKTGEVLVVEKPLSSILLPDCYYTHCSYCFKRSFNLIPCDYCHTTMYCSRKCLKNSFEKNHKTECLVLNVLVELNAWRMELLSLRILIDVSKQGEHLETLRSEVLEYGNNNQQDQYHSLEHINIYNLIGNTEKRSVADLFYRSLTVCVMIRILEKFTSFFEGISNEKQKEMKIFAGGLLLRYMQNLPCNAHEISEFCEEGLIEIGAGAYATLSLINHSCEPNVVRHSYKDVVVLRSIRPIGKNEEIVDNYGYHYATHPFNERQNSLLKQYYFTCNCTACINFWPMYQDIPDEKPIFKEGVDLKVYEKLTESFKMNLDAIFNGDFKNDIINDLYTYLDFLDCYVERPWKLYNKCQEAIKHCLSFQANHFRFSKGILGNVNG